VGCRATEGEPYMLQGFTVVDRDDLVRQAKRHAGYHPSGVKRWSTHVPLGLRCRAALVAYGSNLLEYLGISCVAL
jgi:hypothetical protein